MTHYLAPAAFALFVWWFSTGAIIYLDGLPRRTFRWSMLGATAVLVASVAGLAIGADDATARGAYVAFTCGLLAWGWQEISFYMGFVTGPRSAPCVEGCRGWRHFGHAIQTSLWHELAIIACAAIVVAVTWDQPNQIGTWTFMVLWWMHQSAKLNVFLGVRNLSEEFLPEHLTFLKSFLTRKPMNLLFPVSVTVSTVITALLVMHAAAAPDAFGRVGFTLLATMMALAVLEHWFLVVPLPAAKLWHWGLKSRKATRPFDVEVVAGFLGAGKTTWLRRRLQAIDPARRTVVLVNDFASVGVDGSLLSGQGADVVELPNGCICCSLRTDLAVQLRETIARWAPDRILIEPSGVADVAALLGVLRQPELAPMVRDLDVSAVIDAGAFLADYARMQRYFEAQARFAGLIVVNKADLVTPATRDLVAATLRTINPQARIRAATFGVVLEDAIPVAARPMPTSPAAVDRPAQAHGHDHDVHAHAHIHDAHRRDAAPADRHAHADHGHDDHHHHGHGDHAHDDHAHDDHEHAHHDVDFTSWSTTLDGPCDPDRLHDLLAAIAAGRHGAIERVKGIARTSAGWIRFDVAGGRPSLAAFAPAQGEVPRVVAIGRSIEATALAAAFAACADTDPAPPDPSTADLVAVA